ncbi:NUDIX hydrolase domain-like protein [Cyathus striatus]|nr:NUDIX hydrolase domain-like protein [Cyathus striatus]
MYHSLINQALRSVQVASRFTLLYSKYFMSTSTSLPTPMNVPVPRPSASIVVVNDRNEVLLVHRNPKSRAFGGVHVFPGGNFDSAQDSSLEMTAIRETFEESGLLLTSAAGAESSTSHALPSNSVISELELEAARHAIHRQDIRFKDFLSSKSLKADKESLLRFTEWVTPTNAPRRFHTQFYVMFLPDASSRAFVSGSKQEQLPTPDGGQEVISARFVTPKKALEEFHSGQIVFMPPQFYILTTLAEILVDNVNTRAQRSKVETLSRGPFGRMVINPRRLHAENSEGRTILTYEGDETRGGSKGRLHRALVKVGKEGITTEIILQRNFDIFSEIEGKAFAMSSKL